MKRCVSVHILSINRNSVILQQVARIGLEARLDAVVQRGSPTAVWFIRFRPRLDEHFNHTHVSLIRFDAGTRTETTCGAMNCPRLIAVMSFQFGSSFQEYFDDIG